MEWFGLVLVVRVGLVMKIFLGRCVCKLYGLFMLLVELGRIGGN